MSDRPQRHRILCVDDEERVLQSLTRTLRGSFEVVGCISGAEGLERLRSDLEFETIVSDMRMPGMDGAEFLSKARALRPDVPRILLTGHADLNSAIAAVNDGHVYRFLTKPCATPALVEALEGGVRQYRLVTTERVLLEQTLKGSIEMLVDVLAIMNPTAFGRAERIRQNAAAVAIHLGLDAVWQIEMAAVLSHLGAITLPPETLTKVYLGQALSGVEVEQVREMPQTALRLLSHVPRIEGIKSILAHVHEPFDLSKSKTPGIKRVEVPRGARVLRALTELELLRAETGSFALAIARLEGEASTYDPQVLEAIRVVGAAEGAERSIAPVTVQELQCGMMLAEDVHNQDGVLLVSKGQQITLSLMERLKSFHRRIAIKEPLLVEVRHADQTLSTEHVETIGV